MSLRSSARAATIAALLLPMATIGAQAARSTTTHGLDMSIGLRFGTLGIGPEVSKLVTSHVGLRAGANFFSLNRTFDQSDINFDATVKLKAFSGLVDLYPGSRGSFHFTGGVVTNPASMTGTGVPAGSTFDINGQSYPSSQVGTLNSTAQWSSVLPYAGIGFGTPATSSKAVRFVVDLGAAVGKAKVALSSSMAASNPTLQSDLDAQVKKAQDSLDKLPVYPVVAFGLAFKF